MRTAALPLLLCACACAQGPLAQAVLGRYNAVKLNLIETANAMPEESYSYKLSPAQRNFGEWIEHTALSNYNNCAQIKAEPAPDAAQALRGTTGKAALTKALEASFAYCDAALEGMTDQKALGERNVAGKMIAPVTPMIAMITGLNEHYGNLVGYLRTKGIVPPSTARAQRKK